MNEGTARPRPKEKRQDGVNFAQIKKVLHIATRKSHKHKKCGTNELDGDNDSDYSLEVTDQIALENYIHEQKVN